MLVFGAILFKYEFYPYLKRVWYEKSGVPVLSCREWKTPLMRCIQFLVQYPACPPLEKHLLSGVFKSIVS